VVLLNAHIVGPVEALWRFDAQGAHRLDTNHSKQQ
jgi:hypothetical protein